MRRKKLASIHVNSRQRWDKHTEEIVLAARKLSRLHREAIKVVMRDMLVANEFRRLKAGSQI